MSKISAAGGQINDKLMSLQSVSFQEGTDGDLSDFFICFFIVRDVYITQEGEPKRRESILRTEPKTREEPRTREEPKTREDFMKCESLLYFIHKHEFNCCETSSRNASNPIILVYFVIKVKLKVRGVIVSYSTGILGHIVCWQHTAETSMTKALLLTEQVWWTVRKQMCSSGLLKQTCDFQLLCHVWNTFQQVGTSQRLYWPKWVMDICFFWWIHQKKERETTPPPAKGHQTFETETVISNCIILYCLDSRQLILDVNSVHPNLHLSDGNRTATMKSEPKNYPDHPDRFDHWQQVNIYHLQ